MDGSSLWLTLVTETARWSVQAPAVVRYSRCCLYAWGFGRGAAAYLARHAPELMDQMRMRAVPVARASARSVEVGAPTSGSTLAAIASGVLATVGIILLVPQGIVALTFSLA